MAQSADQVFLVKEHIKRNQMKKRKEKIYLYHRVPANMKGDILYPLNALKDMNSDVYLSTVKKYYGRKHIMEQLIPVLECKWNDVLFFSAVKPVDLKQTLAEAGGEPKEMKFYQIDPLLLDPKQTIIYLFKHTSRRIDAKMKIENFAEYDPHDLEKYSALSQFTKDYFKKEFSDGRRPLLFLGVPHILYKGSIDISGLPIIVV